MNLWFISINIIKLLVNSICDITTQVLFMIAFQDWKCFDAQVGIEIYIIHRNIQLKSNSYHVSFTYLAVYL